MARRAASIVVGGAILVDVAGAAYWARTDAVVRGSRLDSARVRVAARTLAAFGLLTIGACAPAPSLTPQASAPAPSAGISIPTGQLPPDIQCLVDHGVRLVEVKPPQFEGDAPSYVLESDLPPKESRAISVECDKLAPPGREKTDEELRVIYDRWVEERGCLIELGYRPDEPPSFETFVSDWRTTGPWMPIDGVDTNSWTDADYAEAKRRCTLEMFDRD